jgi:HemY protein
MKFLISALLVLVASVALALVVQEDNGYVLLAYGHWTVEGSLAFFLLLNLLLFLLLYYLLRGLAGVWAVPDRVREWQSQRRARRARNALVKGLIALAEGHWKEAEKSLVRHAEASETPLLNYLAAARAAQQQGAHERRDHYLHLAHESMPSADVAVGLTQAELQLSHEQLEQALATLMHLRGIAPRHTYVLKMLKELYLRLEDWTHLQGLLPELRKRKVIDKEELHELEVRIYRRLLERADLDPDPARLTLVWSGIPKGIRNSEDLTGDYVQLLVMRDKEEQAVPLLEDLLHRTWDEALVELYGRIEGAEPARQLSIGEEWLEKHPHNPVLLLALGRLSLRNRLWGKARGYLEAGLGVEPSVVIYQELATLLERMGEQEKALEYYRAGLELETGGPVATPVDNIELHAKREPVLEAPIPDMVEEPRLEQLPAEPKTT